MLKILLNCATLLLLLAAVPSQCLTVMSVDFGAEFMKVAVVAVSIVAFSNMMGQWSLILNNFFA